MTDGDKDTQKDELFEDLDKFFAPIQDVEWPEPEAPARPPTPPGAPVQDPQAGEEEVRMLDDVDAEDGGGGEPDRDAEDTPEVRHDTSVVEGIVVRQAGEPDPEDESPGMLNDDDAIEDEWAAQAPTDVPSAPEDPEPTRDEVEAAAEHFATSVRAGVPEPGERGAEAPEEFPTQVYEDEALIAQTPVEEGILADLDGPKETETVKVGSGEGFGGPSWQEPGSVEVGGEIDRRPGRRDVPAAFLTGIVLAALAIGSLVIGKGVFAIVASGLVLLAQGEIYGVMHRRRLQPATAVGLVTGGLVLAAAYFHGEAAMLSMLALGTLATFLWFMSVPATHRRNLTVAIGSTLFPVVYVPVLAGYALTTLALPDALDGRALMISVIALTFAYDTAAFVAGSQWGTRALAQTISPKKSWEGATAATLVVCLASIGFVAAFVDPLDSFAKSLGLALVVAVFAPLGDLAESLVKRDLDVKDMGSILPGHGGVMDRIDSLLFVAPAALLYFRIFL